MAYTKIANAAPAANTLTTLYTVPALTTIKGNLIICNSGGRSATFDVAISALATPTATEYITKRLYIPANGTITLTDLYLSAAELVVIKSSTDNLSYRLHGDRV